MKSSRKRATRRDRRKAKASGYARLPKKNGIVGHGTSLSFTHTVTTKKILKDTTSETIECTSLRRPLKFHPFSEALDKLLRIFNG